MIALRPLLVVLSAAFAFSAQAESVSYTGSVDGKALTLTFSTDLPAPLSVSVTPPVYDPEYQRVTPESIAAFATLGTATLALDGQSVTVALRGSGESTGPEASLVLDAAVGRTSGGFGFYTALVRVPASIVVKANQYQVEKLELPRAFAIPWSINDSRGVRYGTVTLVRQ